VFINLGRTINIRSGRNIIKICVTQADSIESSSLIQEVHAYHWIEEKVGYSPLLPLHKVVSFTSGLELEWISHSANRGWLQVVQLAGPHLSFGCDVNSIWLKDECGIHDFNDV
jgi:hypothetical protein